MSNRKFNRENARRQDIIRARGGEFVSAHTEESAAPSSADRASFDMHSRLRAEAQALLSTIPVRIGIATLSDHVRLKAKIEQLHRGLLADERFNGSLERFAVARLLSGCDAYLRWRKKKPERLDVDRLFRASVAYIDAAGESFPRVWTCAGAIENLAYLVRWKRLYPSFPLSEDRLKRAIGFIDQYQTVRPLHVAIE